MYMQAKCPDGSKVSGNALVSIYRESCKVGTHKCAKSKP